MAITVSPAPSGVAGIPPGGNYEAERVTAIDVQAQRKRVMELAKNDPSVMDTPTWLAAVAAAEAVVAGHGDELQVYKDNIRTARQELKDATRGTIGDGEDYADLEAKQTDVAAKREALRVAQAAKLIESDTLATATNEEWYGNSAGQPGVEDAPAPAPEPTP